MAQEQDVLSAEWRKKQIDEILKPGNLDRKEESRRRIEIYRSNLKDFLKQALKDEYSEDTASEMRKISSINPAKRVINDMASIYKEEPTRTFNDVNEKQQEVLTAVYREGGINVKFKKANRWFKALQQVAVQIIPQDGVITAKIFGPHQYDVIPRDDNPEKAFAYIINTADEEHTTTLPGTHSVAAGEHKFTTRGQTKSSSKTDRKNMRFIWWTDDLHFITDGDGEYRPDAEDPADLAGAANPVGKLPFIDVAHEKDHEFWVKEGASVVDFSMDFAVLLSDTATSNRNQGFSQAILLSKEKPASMVVGRQRVLWLKQTADVGEKDPSFEFATPSPDLAGSLELLEAYVRFWLTSEGIDPKTVSGKGEAKTFSSGLERLLAMLEKFEATKDDLDLFAKVEDQAFDLIRLWNNQFQNTDKILPELKAGVIDDKASIDTKFAKPEMVQTKAEKEDSAIKMKKAGLIDDVGIVMDLEEVNEDKAIEIVVQRAVRAARVKKQIEEALAAEGLTAVVPPGEEPVEGEEAEGKPGEKIPPKEEKEEKENAAPAAD